MVVGLESGHTFRQFGEDVLFFNSVVERECLAKVQTLRDEGPQRHALWSRARGAGFVQDVPGVAEMVVLKQGKVSHIVLWERK